MATIITKTLTRRFASSLPLTRHATRGRGVAYASFAAQDENLCVRHQTTQRILSSSLLLQQQRTLSISSQSPIKLTKEQRAALSDTILSKKSRFPGGWSMDSSGRDAITKTFNFVDFNQAWEFMSQIAIVAEEMNHHPEWLNIYNRVEVTLTTHDVDGLSNYDVEMSQKMDEIEMQLFSNK